MRRSTVSRLLVLSCLLWLSAALVHADPAVVVNGHTVACSTPPVSRAGVILLPMRPVFQALQAQVLWLPKELKLQAQRGERVIELWIGTPVAQVNRAPVQLDAPPLLIGDAAYVPLPVIGQTFGAKVRWDEAAQTAFIDTASK